MSEMYPSDSDEELNILPVLEDPTRPKYRKCNKKLLQPPFRVSVIGSSKSGKSNYLMNYFRKAFYGGDDPCFTKVIVFSPNLGLDSTTRDLKKIAGENNIHMTYNDGMIDNIIEQQKVRGEARDRILIIADDLIALGCAPTSRIFTASTYLRHLDCSIIYISQTYTGHYSIPPVVKNNLEGCIMFRSPSSKQIEAFSKDLEGTFGTSKNIKEMLEDATREPYHFCFFNYRDLEVYHNHQHLMWRKFDDNGNYSPEYQKGQKFN
jgi:hypothetical protein